VIQVIGYRTDASRERERTAGGTHQRKNGTELEQHFMGDLGDWLQKESARTACRTYHRSGTGLEQHSMGDS
jgi:hypothetical protein